jgi:cobyrinic acid a,c-diamide synthase
LYLGGGYPEAHAARLADNREMLADVRQFAASGRAIYAECGGLMYLGRMLTCLDGVRYPMAGVLPIETTMLEKLKTLGYAEVAWAGGSLWGEAGQIARGHEFHYSEITAEPRPADGWQPAYTVCRPRTEPACGGFFRDRVLAGYVHLHWASRPEAIDHFLCCCEQRS